MTVCDMAASGALEHELFVACLEDSLDSADPISPADCIALDVPPNSTTGEAARYILGVFAGDEGQVEAAGRVRQ